MNRNALYKRIGGRLDLTAIRGVGRVVSTMPTNRGCGAVSTLGPAVLRASKSQRAHYPPVRSGPRLESMSAEATFPVVAGRRRRQPKLPPHQLEELADAKYDFQAVLRDDLDESEILEMFVEDEFRRWRVAKLASLRETQAKATGE